jgi:hypothetical protein
MSRLLLPILLAVIPIAEAEDLAYDRNLVLDAGRAYIASYLRSHFHAGPPELNWSGATVRFVASKHASYDGYVGVFVPASKGLGGGIAYFDVETGRPGRSIIYVWGYTQALAADEARFTRDASAGSRPNPTLRE